MQYVKQQPPVYCISIYISPRSFVDEMKMEMETISPLIKVGLQLECHFLLQWGQFYAEHGMYLFCL